MLPQFRTGDFLFPSVRQPPSAAVLLGAPAGTLPFPGVVFLPGATARPFPC